MKKILFLGAALACLTSSAANAQLIIQPTIVTGGPAYVTPVPVVQPVVIAQPAYPIHHDHHHPDDYNWRYWNDRDHRDHR